MSNRKLLLVSYGLIVLVCSVFILDARALDQDMARSSISAAENSVAAAYVAALEAERAGSNVSSLFVRLDDAGKLLAAARMSDRNGDFDASIVFAGLSEEIGGEVQDDAFKLKDEALIAGSQRSLFTLVASAVGVGAVAFGSLGVWHRLRRRYGQYRGWFIVGSLALMLVAVVPASALYVHLPSGSESFSELWLLGPNHKAEDYPFNVRVDETYSVYLGVGNRLGHSAYYRVYVKFRNETQPLPVASNSTPSFLSELYEFDFVVPENHVWEEMLDFRFLNVEHSSDSVTAESLLINDVAFRVNSTALWNVERQGFYYQLFFELWLYESPSQSFQYDNRFVSLWLNMTA